MICPNCKKEVNQKFYTQRCPYCKYRLIKKENPYENMESGFEKEAYETLKAYYLKNNNKYETIKYGKEKYGLSKSKEIVDYIADEIYEENEHLSYEEANDTTYDNVCEFKFSTIEYIKQNFIHIAIELLIIIQILGLGNFMKSYILSGVSLIWLAILYVITLVKWAIRANSMIIFDCGTILWSRTMNMKRYNSSSDLDYIAYHNDYRIDLVKDIKETRKYIIVKGQINYNYSVNDNGIIKDMNRRLKADREIKIPKYYGKECIEMFYKYKRKSAE